MGRPKGAAVRNFRDMGAATWTTTPQLLALLDEWRTARELHSGDDRALSEWALDRWNLWGWKLRRRWEWEAERQAMREDALGDNECD
jgi:hypothetical protein